MSPTNEKKVSSNYISDDIVFFILSKLLLNPSRDFLALANHGLFY